MVIAKMRYLLNYSQNIKDIWEYLDKTKSKSGHSEAANNPIPAQHSPPGISIEGPDLPSKGKKSNLSIS